MKMEKFEAQMLIKVANRNPFYKQPFCLGGSGELLGGSEGGPKGARGDPGDLRCPFNMV